MQSDSYVRHSTGDWKVSDQSDPVKVWRITEAGDIEENSFSASELVPIAIDTSSWVDPADL